MKVRNSQELLMRLGFVVVIGLVVVSGLLIGAYQRTPRRQFGQPLADLDAQDKSIATVRKFFSQGVASARDFLINNHPNAPDLYAQDLRKAKAGLAGALTDLRAEGADPAFLDQFKRDVDDYWSVLEGARSFTAAQKAESGYDYLREDIFPARNAAQVSLKQIADEAAARRLALMADFNHRRETLITWFGTAMGFCLFFCLMLAWGGIVYRSAVRRESVVELDQVARARDDLEHLSGKLLKVQEEERRSLSRELHDGIGQTLTALRMEIHQAHLSAGTGTPAAERLARARMLAEEAVHTVKDISLLLRPPLLDDLGLQPAIAWQTEQFTRRTGIPCRFRAIGLQELLPDDVKTCVFRVIQEALNNCQKHASPTQVQILIEQKSDALSVRVEDDGAGFIVNERHVRHSGLGILGMRERAVMLGGSVSIQSSPGMGTRLLLSLPLAKMSVSTSRQLDPPASVPVLGAGE